MNINIFSENICEDRKIDESKARYSLGYNLPTRYVESYKGSKEKLSYFFLDTKKLPSLLVKPAKLTK